MLPFTYSGSISGKKGYFLHSVGIAIRNVKKYTNQYHLTDGPKLIFKRPPVYVSFNPLNVISKVQLSFKKSADGMVTIDYDVHLTRNLVTVFVFWILFYIFLSSFFKLHFSIFFIGLVVVFLGHLVGFFIFKTWLESVFE